MLKKFLKRVRIIIGIVFVVLILSVLIIFRHGFQSIALSPYTLPEQSARTWDEVFQLPAPITVASFSTGKMEGDRYPQNPPNAEERYKAMDVLVFGIQHENFGDMLVDTGFDKSFSTDPPFGNYPVMAKLFLKANDLDRISQEKGRDIQSLLHQHNINPQKVFFTHSHIDHTAGIPSLDKSIEFVLDAKELNLLAKSSGHLNGIEEIKTLDWSQARNMPPFGPCLDLLGDASLWAISTPGHSPGHTSYLVNSETGPVLITGDAAFFYWGFANGVGSDMFDMNDEQARKSREQLLAFTKQYPQVKVFAGHEL